MSGLWATVAAVTTSFDAAERRARMAVRHALAARAASVVDAARAVVVLHATDPATVFLSAQARCGLEAKEISAALYERRELVRMLGMRRTLFGVPTELMPVVQASSAPRIAAQQRKLLLKLVDGKSERWLQSVRRGVLAALADGPLTGAQLAKAEPRLATSIVYAPDKAYGGKRNLTSNFLTLFGVEGHITRADPVGSWCSGKHRWMLAEEWYGDAVELPDERVARAELAREWLSAFGPAPMADLTWWTGWPITQVRQALADNDVVEVEIDGAPGVVLAADLAPTPEPEPWTTLLPALDPTIMGWSQRDWYLGEHGPALFDRYGNAGPTIVVSGRVVGGWAHRSDGEIALRLFDDVGAEMRSRIDDEAARLRDWLGEVRFTPRFRTPTERQLSA